MNMITWGCRDHSGFMCIIVRNTYEQYLGQTVLCHHEYELHIKNQQLERNVQFCVFNNP